MPEETAFLKYLREAKVTLQEYEFPVNKVANIGTQTTMLVEKNYYLNKSARDAYRSYLLSYASHSHKDIFNVHELDLQGKHFFKYSVPLNASRDSLLLSFVFSLLGFSSRLSLIFPLFFLTFSLP